MTTAARRRPPTLLVVALALLWLGPLAAPVEASDEPDVRLRLTDVTGVLAPAADDGDADDEAPDDGAAGGEDDALPRAADGAALPEDLALRLLVENLGEEPVGGLRVVVEVHPATPSRDALAATLDEQEVATPPLTISEHDVRDLDELGPGDVAGVPATVPRDQAGWVGGGGVHPVRVAVVRGTEVLDEAVTAVVWLEEAPTDPLLTTFVWPVTDVPWRTTKGHYPSGAQRAARTGGRLDVLLRGLERHRDAGVLLAPSAHLLEDLDDQAAGFTELAVQEDGSMVSRGVEPEDAPARLAHETLRRLREVAGTLPHAPVSGPYADADLDALAEHGPPWRTLGSELSTEGWRRLSVRLDRPADRGTLVVGAPLGPDTLDLVSADHLLLPPHTVEEGEAESTELQPLRASSDRLLTGAVGDARLAELLADHPHGGLVGAQQVLAETAMLHFAAPDRSDRVLSLHPPPDWSPDPVMVDALLERLQAAPWLRLVSPDEQAARGRRSPSEVALRPPEGERLPRDVADRLATALADLEAVQAARPDDAEQAPRRSFRELRDALLRSTSVWLEGGPEAEELIRDVQREVDDVFGEVEVASGSRVTLTAETGQIPVTVRRTGGGPITIRVEVLSPGGLVWEEQRSEDIVLDDDEAHTVSFETRAVSTGTFPVTVVVSDPSGTRELERTMLSVRSTAVSGPALSATGAVVLALLLLGALRRRPRGPRLKIVDGARRREA